MRYGRLAGVVAATISMIVFAAGPATAGVLRGPVRLVDDTDGGGSDMNMDIAVRQVTVTPIRAHVGDLVRIDVVIHDKGEGSETIPAQVYANGKLIGSQLFTFGWSLGQTDTHKTFYWNTSGVKPGEYRIKGEAFLWGDTSPFDNSLTVRQPLLLAAPGAPFPGGETAGGSATTGDPGAGKADSVGQKPAAEYSNGGSY